MKAKLSTLQLSGGEAMSSIQSELAASENQCASLKSQIAAIQQELNCEHDQRKSLEVTMANLTSGNEEMIAREKAAAEERAAQQRERENKHAVELQAVNEKAKNTELRLKTDLNQYKQESAKKEEEMRGQYDHMKKGKDKEIDSLRR